MEQPQVTTAWSSGQSLKSLCRIGGASLMVAGMLYVWAFAAQYILPGQGSGTTENLLQFISTYRWYLVASYLLFSVANSLSIVGSFAVYAMLRVVDRGLALLGAGTLVLGFVFTLASPTAPALLNLSASYSAAAGNVADQQALAIAAVAVTASNNPLIAYVFIGVGVILVSLALRKGSFGRWLYYLGLFVGALNIVRGLPYLSGYSELTLLFVAVSSSWIFGVGREIYRLA